MKFSDLDIHAIGNTIQMAGAIYAGEGRMFICLFPNEEIVTPQYQEIVEMTTDDWKAFLRQTDILEVAILEKASDGTLAKAFVRKSQRHIDTVIQWDVWRRDGYKCRYCGNDKVPLTVDHLILWEEGGPTIHENLITACKKCNKVRGNDSYSKWLVHSYYRDVSRKLSQQERESNVALLATLPDIPRYTNKRTR